MKGICDCVEKFDEKLKAEGLNTQIGVTFHMIRRKGKMGEMVALPAIESTLIEKKRGARPKRIIPSFCPFCGEKFVLDDAAEPAPGRKKAVAR